ncbi:MAG: MarR family transcriptional regulator [Bacteroides sp.]|nr:MarR family transcriptional regulator [Eubacterium sp.]MCM1418778.1 MarR family transcriptional regulator [Roseburia sp.]MCM1462435.1 MarR family transcriptional regulator [Bacteroides sp.]
MDKLSVERLLKSAESSLQSIDKAYSDYARSYGLSYTGMYILEVICDRPDGITQKELCERTFYNKQTVNMVITSFFKRGYIRFEELKTDRRHKYVKLTESGRDFAERAVGEIWRIGTDILDDFTDEEASLFAALLGRYERKFVDEVAKSVDRRGEV